MQKCRWQKNKIDKLFKFIPVMLIVTGTMLILMVACIKWQVNTKQKAMIEAYNAAYEKGMVTVVTDKDGEKIPDNSNTYTKNMLDSTTDAKTKDPHLVADGQIGLLMIPKIDLTVAVSEGVDKRTLRYAVGHFDGTALPGEKGNFCLTGHRSYTYGEFFNRLDELKTGDNIIVKYGGADYTYIVTDVFVVEPEEVWVLDTTLDPEITLVTCTPLRIATHRLIVRGILKT